MNLMYAVNTAGLEGKWDLHSIALNAGWDRIVDRPLELERLSDFNIHLSDTRQYLSNTLPNHKKKNTLGCRRLPSFRRVRTFILRIRTHSDYCN